MDDRARAVVPAVLIGSGVLLFVAGVGVVAMLDNLLLGGALIAAAVGDLVAAMVIRSRSG